jgi:hypothetical protein
MLFASLCVRIHKHKIFYVLAALSWLVLGVFTPVARAQQAAEELIAPKPFISTVIDGLGITNDKTGAPIAVAVVRGMNVQLEVVNLKTQKRLVVTELRNDGVTAGAAAYVALPNRHVLVGTTTGYVYDVDPDKQSVVELTVPQAGSPGFTAGTQGDGTVSYWLDRTATGSRLYGYTAQTSKWRDFGTVPSLTNGIVYANGVIYLGSDGQNATVYTVNAQTGAQASFTIPGVPADTKSVNVTAVFESNLYVTVASSSAQTYVYDTKTNTVVDTQPSFGTVLQGSIVKDPQPEASTTPQAVQTQPTTQSQATTSTGTQTQPVTDTPGTTTQTNQGQSQTPGSDTKPTTTQTQAQTQTQTQTTPTTTTPTEETVTTGTQTTTQKTEVATVTPKPKPVYFGAFSQYNPGTKQVTTVANTQGLQPVSGNCWTDETHCVVFNQAGRIGTVNTAARSFKLMTPSPFTGGYQATDFVTIGADDTVFAASAAPGTALLQLDRDKAGLSKVVGLGGATFASLLAVDDTVLAGTSTGRLVRYDVSKRTATPAFDAGVKAGDGSVTALARVGEARVVYGVSQTAGSPTGAIGIYDISTGAVRLPAQAVLKDQTVGSVVYGQGKIYVGGVNPAGSATLLAYDVAHQNVTAQTIPVPGKGAITSLVIGANGHVYGMAGSTLFEADPGTLTVRNRHALSVTDQAGNLLFWQGQLLASVAGKIYQVKADTLVATYVTNGVNLRVNSRGDMYYSRGAALYRTLAPHAQVAAVTKVQKSAVPRFNFSVVDIRVRAGIVGLFGVLLLAGLGLKLHQRRQAHAVYRARR